MIALDLNKKLDIHVLKCPEVIELQRVINTSESDEKKHLHKDGIFGLYTEKQLKLIINKSKTTLSYMREWGFEVRDEISESEVWWLNTITDRQEHEKRKAAMEWWNSLASLRKTQLCDTNTEIVGHVRRHETLTGSEIEKIYNKTQL